MPDIVLAKIKNIKIEQYKGLFQLFTLFTALFYFAPKKSCSTLLFTLFTAMAGHRAAPQLKLFSKSYKKIIKTVFILGNNSYICTTKIK